MDQSKSRSEVDQAAEGVEAYVTPSSSGRHRIYVLAILTMVAILVAVALGLWFADRQRSDDSNTPDEGSQADQSSLYDDNQDPKQSRPLYTADGQLLFVDSAGQLASPESAPNNIDQVLAVESTEDGSLSVYYISLDNQLIAYENQTTTVLIDDLTSFDIIKTSAEYDYENRLLIYSAQFEQVGTLVYETRVYSLNTAKEIVLQHPGGLYFTVLGNLHTEEGAYLQTLRTPFEGPAIPEFYIYDSANQELRAFRDLGGADSRTFGLLERGYVEVYTDVLGNSESSTNPDSSYYDLVKGDQLAGYSEDIGENLNLAGFSQDGILIQRLVDLDNEADLVFDGLLSVDQSGQSIEYTLNSAKLSVPNSKVVAAWMKSKELVFGIESSSGLSLHRLVFDSDQDADIEQLGEFNELNLIGQIYL